MATRSFSTVKASVSALITSRGYAATAQSAVRGGAATISGSKMGPKMTEEKAAAAAEKVSWAPDPVTGYYKPENIKDIDVADLRATLLTKKFNH
ncbi:hypothetical protein PIB30_029776 [Stylosanthes scabra]|uniref:Uncharacterized protein n=1 Tax=Stylosanthes scabra TaxID=79078 RepID=A0ABU6RBL1_9FABA|nr:hypothetical protein [Stylosanthes scabra]